MRHFEALRGHFRQDLADPAHFVLVRTCKGHIHLDITNFSTSRHLPVPATSPGSRDPAHLPQDSAVSRILRSSGPRCPRQDSRLGAGNPALGQDFPTCGTGIPATGQGNPGFPARSGNPEFPGAGQEFLLRRAPRGDPPSDARFSILVFAL